MKLKFLKQAGHWPSGNARYYVRKGKAKMIAMPDCQKESAAFLSAWNEAVGALEDEFDRAGLQRSLRQTFLRAKGRSSRRGMEFSLDFAHLVIMAESQGWRCSETRRRFDTKLGEDGFRRPWAPSIDRIDNRFGYTPDNIRIVCAILNLARGDFAKDDFGVMCRNTKRT